MLSYELRSVERHLENFSESSLDRESRASQCMNIHKNPRISKWISIKARIIRLISIKTWISINGYFYGYPLRNVLAWISLLGYQCEYPPFYEQLRTDNQNSWISMLISVDNWKSMYGYAMDSRTTVDSTSARSEPVHSVTISGERNTANSS